MEVPKTVLLEMEKAKDLRENLIRQVERVKATLAENAVAIESIKAHIAELESLYEAQKNSDNRRLITEARTELNATKHLYCLSIGQFICSILFDLEGFKVDGLLNESLREPIRELYVMLINHGGKPYSRYKKLPDSWLSIGFCAGFMEDLVVVMRTGSQLGIFTTHVSTVEEIVAGFRHYLTTVKPTNVRFAFMTYAFDKLSDSDVSALIVKAVKSQGVSQRVGFMEEKMSIYAIQGLYGRIDYDPRVVRVLTPECFANGSAPKFAIHFTQADLAEKIWTKAPTENTRAKGAEIPVGQIVRFMRVIHGLTCVVEDEDGILRIAETHASIHDRMAHGLCQSAGGWGKEKSVTRGKYQAGIILDLEMVVHTLAPGSVMLNELGTLLVKENIPHKCMIEHVHGDRVDDFWRLDPAVSSGAGAGESIDSTSGYVP
jgi:hypothetical protein